MSKKSEILHIHPGGGATRSALNLCNLLSALDLDKYPSRVLLIGDGGARQLFEASGIEVNVLKSDSYPFDPDLCNGYRKPIDSWKAFFPNHTLLAYLQKAQPSLIHVHGQDLLQEGITCYRRGVPVIWHLRDGKGCSDSKVQKALENFLAFRFSRQVITGSEISAYHSKGNGHLQLIYPSFNTQILERIKRKRSALRRAAGLEDQDVVIGMVGCLCDFSGAWDFIRTAGQVYGNLPNTDLRFMLLATGSKGKNRTCRHDDQFEVDKSMERKAWHLAYLSGIENDFSLEKYHPDLLEQLGIIDLLVSFSQPGIAEWATLAALAMGVPTVQVRAQGEAGTPAQDAHYERVLSASDLDVLATVLTRLAKNAEFRHKMGKQAFQSVHQRLTPQYNARLMERIYSEVL